MANRLATSTSPYLLQHADNPVDWYPWSPEALERARREDKPILLSIGYAACHWCHVMERESFEDPEVARLMNEWFVCVKVDREERPDLDAIYMAAVQAMTGHGGWPMTVFLTPDGRPFYGGTYFPPVDRHGLPAFRRVLEAVHDAWVHRREEVLAQSDALHRHLAVLTAPRPRGEEALSEEVLRRARDRLLEAFDPEWGGFGGPPKFPQPLALELCLRLHARGMPGALEAARRTLAKMARGGIFDQVGGGFHRYAVDRRWLVPHFEKMLYDNAQLLRLYARAWLVTADPLFRETALATADYLLREMRHPEGGFFSSQDADSEGVEGRYYVWSYEEFVLTAGPDDELAAARYDVTPAGNWEGRSILWRPRDDDVVALERGVSVAELLAASERARARLAEARRRRVPPATDDKVIAAWNALAVSGLAEAGRVFGRPDLVEAAEAAAAFVLRALRGPGGRLLRAWREGRASGPAYLEDHALLAGALLDLYETTFDERLFDEATRLVDEAIRLFADEEGGGFFDTAADAEPLLLRPRELMDNPLPSGSSAMAEVLLRLAALTGDARLEERAAGVLRLVGRVMGEAPTAFPHLLAVLDLSLDRPKEIAVSGDPAAEDARRLVAVVWGRYLPNRVLAVGRSEGTRVPLLRDRPPLDGRAAAYVCERFVCRAPVAEPEELAALLGGPPPSR
jgi:uncharacterized protein YyaL (SSP411 family)